MTVDLRSVTQDDEALSHGGYTGAVFLTFTLNLSFYEKIIAVDLDRSGCSNVLIIADPDGYAGALDMGVRSINGVGRHYLCVPLARQGRGVQHAKILLMAGPRRGRLLIGSGNLTFSGYGRNLELFSNFAFGADDSTNLDHYAFCRAWQLLQALRTTLPRTALGYLDALQGQAPWLASEIDPPADFQVWDSTTESIWEQLAAWRRAKGLQNKPLLALQVISPYFDHDLRTLRDIFASLQPKSAGINVDPANTRLDLAQLRQAWHAAKSRLEVFGLRAATSKRPRALHAKAVVGLESNGSWCLSGSSNLTYPALRATWAGNGNLELVTFRWSDDVHAFDYLLADRSVKAKSISDQDDLPGNEAEPSERIAHLDVPCFITDLMSQGDALHGTLSALPKSMPQAGHLHLLRANKRLPFSVGPALDFNVLLPSPLTHAEAARLELGGFQTPYRWIDQLDELARYGARSYHARTRAKLETFRDAESLLKELMNFLWDRVDPTQLIDEDQTDRLTRIGTLSGKRKVVEGEEPEEPTPPPEHFITEERLLHVIGWRLEQHQHPYDKSNASLRDLLSLVLIRLTTPTHIPEATSPTGERDEEADQERVAEQEAERLGTLQRLRSYLVQYCRRYSERLTDQNFVHKVGYRLLFSNHFVLGRVLLEFASKVDTFTPDDLFNCFWWTWAPLAWPEIASLSGPSVFESLARSHSRDELWRAWRETGLPSMALLLFKNVLGRPPKWQDGLWDNDGVRQFMAARELMERLQQFAGDEAFFPNENNLVEAMGIGSLADVEDGGRELKSSEIDSLRSCISLIADYVPPTEERLSPLLRFIDLDRAGKGQSVEAVALVGTMQTSSLADELRLYKRIRLPAKVINTDRDEFDDEGLACPVCGLLTTEACKNELKGGKLVLCPADQDALFYWKPRLPRRLDLG